MVRFIFVCMAIVALSIVTMASQFMVDGIKNEQQAIAARNVQTPETIAAVETAAAPDQAAPEEALNNIDTAAGGNDSFGESFTNVAPAALGDDAPPSVSSGDALPFKQPAN